MRDRDITLLRMVPMLHLLPLPSVERLARGLGPVEVAAGVAVFAQGDLGDHYYVIGEGTAEVVADGTVVATLSRGEGFGEIALLRRTGRRATVRAVSNLRLMALDSEHFLPVVLGYIPSAAAAQAGIDTILGGPSSRRDDDPSGAGPPG